MMMLINGCSLLPSTITKGYCEVAEYIILDEADVLTQSTKRQILKHDLNVQEICHKEIPK